LTRDEHIREENWQVREVAKRLGIGADGRVGVAVDGGEEGVEADGHVVRAGFVGGQRVLSDRRVAVPDRDGGIAGVSAEIEVVSWAWREAAASERAASRTMRERTMN